MKQSRWSSHLILLLAATGFLLSIIPMIHAGRTTVVVTLLHLVIGGLLIIWLVPFLWQHIRQKRQFVFTRPGQILLLPVLLVMIASGIWLVVAGQQPQNAWIHTLFGVLLILLLLWHVQSVLGTIFTKGLVWGIALLVLLALGATWLENEAQPQPVLAQQYAQTPLQLVGTLPPYDEGTMSPDRCAACHAKIAAEWQQSLHSVADVELIYARVVSQFRREHGIEASNYCAGCHSPLRMARGQLERNIAKADQANVDCLVCHSIQTVHQPVGNNRAEMRIWQTKSYDWRWPQSVADRFLLMQPEAHKGQWNGAVMQESLLCGSCHRQVLPASLSGGPADLVLQDTFTEWQNSPYNNGDVAEQRTCQDCHMPTGEDGGTKRSHLFAGVNMDVAQIMGFHDLHPAQQALLQEAATLEVMAAGCEQEAINLLVTVTNSGTGHNLPTGVTDLRQVWLEVTAVDDHNTIVFQSGHIDQAGVVDPQATIFHAILGDENGQPVYFHDIMRARQILQDTTIPPKASHQSNYQIPALKNQTLNITAKLQYRLIPQNFVNHYMAANLRFRVITMNSESLQIDVPKICSN